MVAIIPVHTVAHRETYLSIYHAKEGQGLPRHDHPFNHYTICHAGSIVIRKENKEMIMTKETQPVNLVANEWHEIEALEDDTVFVNVFGEGTY